MLIRRMIHDAALRIAIHRRRRARSSRPASRACPCRPFPSRHSPFGRERAAERAHSLARLDCQILGAHYSSMPAQAPNRSRFVQQIADVMRARAKPVPHPVPHPDVIPQRNLASLASSPSSGRRSIPSFYPTFRRADEEALTRPARQHAEAGAGLQRLVAPARRGSWHTKAQRPKGTG